MLIYDDRYQIKLQISSLLLLISLLLSLLLPHVLLLLKLLLLLLLVGLLLLVLLLFLLLVLLLLGWGDLLRGMPRDLLGMACLGLGHLALNSHLLVVGLLLSKDFLPELLLSFVDVWIKLIAIFPNRKLLVVINWYEYLFIANWLFLWVVELSDVGMLQSFLNRQPLVWIEL